MLQPRKITYFEYALAIGIRFALIHSDFKHSIHDRVEISTPINSYKRLLEGIHLYNQEMDPYSGDLFHETPIFLYTFRSLIQYLGQQIELLFIVFDIITAHLLYQTTRHYLYSKQKEEKNFFEKGIFTKKSANLLISEEDTKNIPAYVGYAYLFNPYIIFNCVGLTTTGLTNLILSGIFYSMVKKQKLICSVLVSLLTLQSFYSFTLLVPVCFQFYNFERTRKCVFVAIITFLTSFVSLLYLCFVISGSWKFISSTFGFVLNVTDLTPNIGLFWYFFTEMFEHFRALFISALQINATVLYLFPLSLHLKNEPVFLSFILVALTAIFKSYPNLGDVGFYFSLLPIWKHLFYFMQQSFFITCILVIASVFGPGLWHLWIYSGSANANFFFGVTLAFATAEIFLITDMLFAHKKRCFALKHGLPDESSECTLVLD